MEPQESHKSRLSALQEVIERDLLAADVRISLFVSAAKSFKYDSCLQPFPPAYLANNEKKIEELVRVLDSMPSLSELRLSKLEAGQLDLLHWILCRVTGPTLRMVAKSDFEAVLAKAPCLGTFQRPQHIFEVVYPDDSNSERRFRSNLDSFQSHYAYHGSKLFNFYSILNYGLQQHLNKTAVFGEGIYLSAELHVSQMFAPTGSGWHRSTLGTHLSCTALCEYIDNPAYVKWQEENQSSSSSSIPEKYVLVKNNEMVRVRYLLVYASGRTGIAKTDVPTGGQQQPLQRRTQAVRTVPGAPPNRCIRWMTANISWLLAGGYLAMLFFIGLMNSPNAHYMKQMFLQKFSYMCNALFGSESDT